MATSAQAAAIRARRRPDAIAAAHDARARDRHRIEAKLRADFERSEGHEIWPNQEPHTYAFAHYLVAIIRADPSGGLAIHRSKPQMVRGFAEHCGWELFPTVKQLEHAYGHRVKRLLRLFTRMGWLEGAEAQWEGPQSTGILLRVPAGVAQSVQAAGTVAPRRRGGPHAPPPGASGPPPAPPPRPSAAPAADGEPGPGRASRLGDAGGELRRRLVADDLVQLDGREAVPAAALRCRRTATLQGLPSRPASA